MKSPRYKYSFHPIVKPKKDQSPALKLHYNGVVRELVGYLERLARLNPDHDRFIFPSIGDMVEGCKRYKQPTNNYGRTVVIAALDRIREHGIISARFQRWFDGKVRFGFYVAPTEALVVEEDGQYVFKGFDPSRCGDWWVHKAELFRIDRNKLADLYRVPDFDTEGLADKLAKLFPGERLGGRDGERLGGRPISGQTEDTSEVKSYFRPLALVTVNEPYEPLEPLEPRGNQGNDKNNSNPKSNTAPACADALTPLTDQSGDRITVGDYFDAAGDIMDAVTDGEYDIASTTRYLAKPYLEQCVQAVVEEHRDFTFEGRKTCARLMGAAMARLRNEHREEVPKPWLPTMQQLRATPGHARYQSNVQPKKTPNAKDNTPTDWHKEHGYELCDDGIWRAERDRVAQAFTLKNGEGIWERTEQ